MPETFDIHPMTANRWADLEELWATAWREFRMLVHGSSASLRYSRSLDFQRLRGDPRGGR